MFRQPRDNHRSLETGRRGQKYDSFSTCWLSTESTPTEVEDFFLYIYIYTRTLHSRFIEIPSTLPSWERIYSPLPSFCPVKKNISSTYAATRYTFIIPSKYTSFRYERRVHLGNGVNPWGEMDHWEGCWKFQIGSIEERFFFLKRG